MAWFRLRGRTDHSRAMNTPRPFAAALVATEFTLRAGAGRPADFLVSFTPGPASVGHFSPVKQSVLTGKSAATGRHLSVGPGNGAGAGAGIGPANGAIVLDHAKRDGFAGGSSGTSSFGGQPSAGRATASIFNAAL